MKELRYSKLGIKQTIQKAWMDKTVQMLLAGLSKEDIRLELKKYLSTQKQSGGIGKRGEKTYGLAISVLASWFAPKSQMVSFRNELLDKARLLPVDSWIPLHWAIVSANYPFWFNVAKQIGRLLNLQDQVTQKQIFNRLIEQYGDRETVARNARYVVRSLVAWGVLKDSRAKGCYEKATAVIILDSAVAILLLESALLAMPEAQFALELLINNPAFFPFELPPLSGDFISQHSQRIEVIRYGLNSDLLKLMY